MTTCIAVVYSAVQRKAPLLALPPRPRDPHAAPSSDAPPASPSGLVARRACSWPRFRCWAISIQVSHSALHYSRACLPGLPTLHRAVQVITLEVSGPLRALDKNGLNLTFASKFPKVHFVQEVQSSPSVAIDPCTPRHLAF